jgi:LysM repeat protein
VVDPEQLRDWAPRLLAPLAFFVAATVLVLVVHRALNADSGATPTPPASVAEPGTSVTQPSTSTRGETPPAKKKFYRVRPGDTLDAIATRFKTTTADLVTLNPKIDPLSLSVGQRIRIR